MEVLSGHTSPETAYVVEDYPYGYRLRTTIRYWIETKKGFGQRFMSQTVNPKTGRWNKPKNGTYCDIQVLVKDDQGHVSSQGLHSGRGQEAIDAFRALAGEYMDKYQVEAMKYLEAVERANQRVTVRVHTCQPGCTEQHQTTKEQADMMRGVIGQEMRRGS